jgi:hypothetical protein
VDEIVPDGAEPTVLLCTLVESGQPLFLDSSA